MPAHNPTGVYERNVLVPASFTGKRVVLHVGAAESVALVSIDGVDLGVGKDSHLPSEFDAQLMTLTTSVVLFVQA